MENVYSTATVTANGKENLSLEPGKDSQNYTFNDSIVNTHFL